MSADTARTSACATKDFALCLSLSNLCFLQAWSKLESGYLVYFRKNPRTALVPLPLFAAALCDILLLASASWVLVTLVRRSGSAALKRALQVLFLAALIVPLNILRTEYGLFAFASLGKTGAMALTLAGAIALWLVLRSRLDPVVRFLSFAVTAFLPLMAFAVFQTASVGLRKPPAAAAIDGTAGSLPLSSAAPKRVLWLIFDELDQRLAFLARPPGIGLPQLDRLRSESFYASHAETPGADTLDALPALTVGQPIVADSVAPVAADDLRFRFQETGRTAHWRSQPNIFAEARAAGANTAVVGWYHPYCRVLGSSLTSCFWVPADSQFLGETLFREAGFFESMRGFAKQLLLKAPGVVYFGLLHETDRSLSAAFRKTERDAHIREYREIHARALQECVDPKLGFALFHWPVPHPQGMYSRATHSITDADHTNYIDNLELADQTLGELRRTLESAGLWDSTTILLSADHPLRTAVAAQASTWTQEEAASTGNRVYPWVPFLLKLAGERSGVTYDAPFSALLSHDLMLAILRSQVTTARDAAMWLDLRRKTPRN